MSDTRTDIPSPSAPNFEQRVREVLMTYLGRQGNPLDRGLTLRDLVDNGIIQIRDGFTLRPGMPTIPLAPGAALPGGGSGGSEPELDLTPPPQPTGFAVASAISHVFIGHDAPLYTQGGGHLRTRVYGVVYTGGPLPVFTDAVEITQFTGTVHAHPSNPATTWRLWIKWETRAGVLSNTPAGGTNGLAVTTAQDVALLLEALTGQITESQLAALLASRINLIDDPATNPGSVNARIQDETNARVQAIQAESNARQLADNDLAASIAAEASARQIADAALSAATELLGNEIGVVGAGLAQEQRTRADADSATATQVTAIVAVAQGNQSAILVEQQTRADADAASAGQVATLAVLSGANSAALSTEQQVRADADSSLSGQTLTLAAETTRTSAALVVEQQARADTDASQASQITSLAASTAANTGLIQVEQQVRADADSATAGQITSLASVTGSTAAALVTEQNTRASADFAQVSTTDTLATAVGSNAAALVTQSQVSSAADSAQAGQITLLAASTADNTAAIFTEQGVRAGADSAQAAVSSGLAVSAGTNSAGILTEQQVRATADSAASAQLNSLASAAGSNAAAIVVEASTRSTQDSSLASQITTVSAATSDTSAALTNEINVRASETGALAQQTTTLQALREEDKSALELESFLRNVENESLLVQYTVKVDVNGYVTGFGLASEKVDGKITSNFAIRADSFYIASPSGPGITPTMPFMVRTTPTVINGVTVNPGVYITDAFIQNGTITNAKIANLAVDNAKIANVSVDKLTAGSVAVGQHIQSTNYVPNTAGWRIDGNGVAEFSGVTVRGNVIGSTITGGTINGSVITGATIQTAASGQRVEFSANGIYFLTGATPGKYGTFKYGTASGRKYGSGVLVYFNDAVKRVPFYVAAEQNVADIHLFNRGADPTGATYEAGDMICVNGRLKIFVPALGGWRTVALEP